MSEENSAIFRTLGVTPEQVIGYLYSGFLSLICITFIDPDDVKLVSNSLGGILFSATVMTLGIGIFTFYFKVIGEIFLFPFQYLIHQEWDRIRGKIGEEHTATTAFLSHIGVHKGLSHHAYQEIKSTLYTQAEKQRIHLSHGELHVLYLTSVILGTATAFSYYKGSEHYLILIFTILTIIFLLAALVADTVQQSIETNIIKNMDRKKLIDELCSKGFIDKPKNEYVSIEHIGINTSNIELFEKFWCDIIGYARVYENKLTHDLTSSLFKKDEGAIVHKYTMDGSIDLELHLFKRSVYKTDNRFYIQGYNHIALHVYNREDFLNKLPDKIRIHSYNNPKGWKNIFIQDFEGNWVELRESF